MKAVVTVIVAALVLAAPAHGGDLTPLSELFKERVFYGVRLAPKGKVRQDALEKLVRQFEDMALFEERLVEGREIRLPRDRIGRWHNNRVSLRLDPALAEYKEVVEDTATLLAEVTGLQFNIEPWRGKNGGSTGMDVHFTADVPGSCRATAYSSREFPGALFVARVEINRKLDKYRIPACLFEEIAQSLGLTGDTDAHGNTMFHRRTAGRYYKSFTEHDALVFRAFFDRRIRPGMSKEQAMQVVPTIIEELIAELNG